MKNTLVQELLPPFLFRSLRSIKRRLNRNGGAEQNGLKRAEWYDEVYDNSAEYRVHYTRSRYYFVWSVIADRLSRGGAKKVLDMGCGPGQVANMLHDRGITDYVGLDFSHKSIQLAREICPDFDFQVADICESDAVEKLDYDTVITMEFLEHVEGDVEVIRRIRQGTRFLGTVPNFPYVSHVRHFENCEQVAERYGSCFRDLSVDSFLEDPEGKTYFLIDGVRD